MDLSFLPDQDTEEECVIFKAVTKVTKSYNLSEFFKMIEEKHDYAYPMYDEYKYDGFI